LNPYLDADTELGGHNAIIPAIRNVLENDKGELTRLASGFSLITVIGDSRFVGPELGWTTEDMLAAKDKAAPGVNVFSYFSTRNDILTQLLYYNLPEYVNWETGETSFTSPDFIKLLELVKSFPETFNWENEAYRDEQSDMLSGNQLLQIAGIYSFDEIMRNNALFNGNVAYKGFPCASKKGSSFQLQSPIAMTTKCKDKEGAWRFMRMILAEEFQRGMWYLPTNKVIFDEQAKTAMTNEIAYEGYTNWFDETSTVITNPDLFPAYTDNKDGSFTNSRGETIIPKNYIYIYDQKGGSTQVIPYYAMSQSTYDQFLTLLNSIDRIGTQNDEINSIINEELGPFFSNQKTAEDTAAVIQSRARIYVNEQR
jgi:hypothetical protein